MAITSAEIISKARQITSRDNETDLPDSDIELMIAETVLDISERTMCLKEEVSDTLAADSNTIAKPTNMIDSPAAIDTLYLDETLLDPITYEEWRAGCLDGYAYRNGTIYINPTPDSDKSYTLSYRKVHSSDITTLELGDEFKRAVIYLVCQKIFEDYTMEDEAMK